MLYTRLDTRLNGRDGDWTFVGVAGWKESDEGIIYPPVWSCARFDPDPAGVPDAYAHELGREDFALMGTQALEDTDIAVDYKCPYGSVIHGGIVFRAQDSVRFYVLDIIELGRKAQAYELTLWVQERSGYRRALASARMPHSVIPDRILQGGTLTREEWDHSSANWVRVRVQASGTFIRVSMDDQIAFDLRDETYAVGCVGLAARGAVFFRDLKVEGIGGHLPEPWTSHVGEFPSFCYPGGDQPPGMNAYPVVCTDAQDRLLVAWFHNQRREGIWPATVLTISPDGGQTWEPPRAIFSKPCYYCMPSSLFSHRDGSLTCMIGFSETAESGQVALRLRSTDGGQTWEETGELEVSGRLLSTIPYANLYSPMQRLTDGSVVMCGYEADDSRGHGNDMRRDRSLLFRSDDDGLTWEGPVYFDEENFDHNECMVAEAGPGRLIAFMRTLRATSMWTSSSTDGGETWQRLEQTEISAECPSLLAHSSGMLIMGSRGCGTFVQLSVDSGETWGDMVRISPASAMVGMVELADARVFIAMHEGYRNPGFIRGQFFRPEEDGPVPA